MAVNSFFRGTAVGLLWANPHLPPALALLRLEPGRRALYAAAIRSSTLNSAGRARRDDHRAPPAMRSATLYGQRFYCLAPPHSSKQQQRAAKGGIGALLPPPVAVPLPLARQPRACLSHHGSYSRALLGLFPSRPRTLPARRRNRAFLPLPPRRCALIALRRAVRAFGKPSSIVTLSLR
jgi:hypothetical protein